MLVHPPGMYEFLVLLLGVIRAGVRSRADLVAENLLLRHQLTVLARPTRKRPPLRGRDTLLWALARRLCAAWRGHLVLVRPEAVVRWHRQAWRLFWWWRSRRPVGGPRLSAEVRELIAVLSRDNPRWGTERIRGELLKLGIAVSNRSIRRYRRHGAGRRVSAGGPSSPITPGRSGRWTSARSWTLTFKTLHVVVFIAHGRRELVHWNVTASPTTAWVWRQLIEATPRGRRPRYLLRDRDAVYGDEFRERARRLGIETLLSPVRAPRANAIAERVIGTLRRECLDHLLVLNQQHLRVVLREFVRSYNADRPHRSLALEPPQPALQLGTGPARPPGPSAGCTTCTSAPHDGSRILPSHSYRLDAQGNLVDEGQVSAHISEFEDDAGEP